MRDQDLQWVRQPGANGMPVSVTHKRTGRTVTFDPKVHGVATRGVSKRVPLHKRAQADMLAALHLMVEAA
jgi:hypothetical protein